MPTILGMAMGPKLGPKLFLIEVMELNLNKLIWIENPKRGKRKCKL